MKKIIYLVSAIIFLLGCASTPENKEPLDESIVKLHRAKEIQCSFTKFVFISLTEQGELEVDQDGASQGFGDEMRLLCKINPKSNNATIYYLEGEEDPYPFASKVQRGGYGIYFFVEVDEGGFATITVFSADDVSSDYVAAITLSGELYDGSLTWVFLGSCKVIE